MLDLALEIVQVRKSMLMLKEEKNKERRLIE
jgi:hypothetical protein